MTHNIYIMGILATPQNYPIGNMGLIEGYQPPLSLNKALCSTYFLRGVQCTVVICGSKDYQ